MDLIRLVEKEMAELQIYEPFEVARYLYIRTGQLFEYHPFYAYLDAAKQKVINGERKNIFDIKDFYVTCFSWSHLYIDLLSYFGIKSKVVSSANHCFVLVFINDMVIRADLMAYYFDFYRTKLGLNTRDYTSKMNDIKWKLWETDRKITLFPSIRIEAVLAMIRQEIKNNSHNEDELISQSFDAASLLMEYYSFGHITGKKFLRNTLDYFSDNLYSEYGGMGTFYDILNQQRIDIFSYYMPSDVTRQQFYRFDSRDNGVMKLVRTNKKEIRNYYHSMDTDQTDYFRSIIY